MTQRILEILDNVRYWETCPIAYKQDIETFLNSQTEQLDLPVVVRQSEQLKDKQTPTFEEYTERFYNVYQGNNYKDKKTGTFISFNDLIKEYDSFIISL